MDANQALSTLDRAVSTIQADRQTHAVLQQAIEVLNEAIRPKTAKEEKELNK